MRLRTTAVPSFLVTVKPNRAGWPSLRTCRRAGSPAAISAVSSTPRARPASALAVLAGVRILPSRSRLGVLQRLPPRMRRKSLRRLSVRNDIASPPSLGTAPSTHETAPDALHAGPAHRAGPTRLRRSRPAGRGRSGLRSRAFRATPASSSGRQSLAAFGAAAGNDLHATRRRHPRTITMPALAHEFARLIRPLHTPSPFLAVYDRARQPPSPSTLKRCHPVKYRRGRALRCAADTFLSR